MDNRDERYMALALDEGYKGKGKTAPNPAVGAVLIKDDAVIGIGYHAKAGEPHAEVLAIRQAGGYSADSELYVTLEPCNHRGLTPPCTEAIIESGISRVIIGTVDPNPGVRGGGIDKLRGAGIKVEEGVLRNKCRELCEDFAKFTISGIPFITAKYAMTLDGKIASPTGNSFWITSEKSRERAHLIRWRNDAVIVGSATVKKDNPRLTVRLDGFDHREGPVRVVVSSKGEIPPDSEVLVETPKPPTWVACSDQISADTKRKLIDGGAEVIVLTGCNGRVDLMGLLVELGKRGLMGVLVEGGGDILGAMIDTGSVDKVCAFIAPKVIGGSGKSPIEGRGKELMSEAIDLRSTSIEQIDSDLFFKGYITDIDTFFPAE